MAVQQQTYTVETFDYQSASKKKLVAMIDGSDNIIGTGVLKVNSPNNLVLTVDGEEYAFNSEGQPVSNNAMQAGYSLKMGISEVNAITKGTIGTTSNAFIRSIDAETGDVTYEAAESLDKSYEITIDALNARDQFAIQALHGIMEKLPNPDELSKDEITHYCDAAYTWASYMMKLSSEARSVIQDADASDNTQTEEVGYLDSNTEKLLNNIVAALDKTNASITINGSSKTAERITAPELNIKLDTLITSVNSLKTALDNQTTALNAIAAAISGSTPEPNPEEVVEE